MDTRFRGHDKESGYDDLRVQAHETLGSLPDDFAVIRALALSLFM
jgi:hypothetical protein